MKVNKNSFQSKIHHQLANGKPNTLTLEWIYLEIALVLIIALISTGEIDVQVAK